MLFVCSQHVVIENLSCNNPRLNHQTFECLDNLSLKKLSLERNKFLLKYFKTYFMEIEQYSIKVTSFVRIVIYTIHE